MTEDIILSCPFCAKAADIVFDNETHNYVGYCHNCGAMGEQMITKSEAINAWNTRNFMHPEFMAKYVKLTQFVKSLAKHSCCLCDPDRCRCCNALDILSEIGEV